MSARRTRLPVSFPPMESTEREVLPEGPGWQYEPKWDGFRCLAFRDGPSVDLRSKSGKPLGRYFPEVVAAVLRASGPRFVLDGELVVPVGGRLSFDDLLQRIHPAASRVRALSESRPARLVAFDLLQEGDELLAKEPLEVRRKRLEAFAKARLRGAPEILLSPATRSAAAARRWLSGTGHVLDGVIAKRLGIPYGSGTRDAMVKVKRRRTADCVIGGFRRSERGLASILLGLHDAEGVLHHVGFASAIPPGTRAKLLARLERLRGGPGFRGRAPGGPSRWTQESTEWVPVRPRVVVEVEYDHTTGDRFRHGTRFLRLRPDKDPKTCGMEQLAAGPRAVGISRLLRPRRARAS